MSTASPFQSIRFRYLFAAQVTSLLGSGLTQVALALLAFDLVGIHAAAVLGIAWSMRVLASVTIAPIVGGFVHRLPRKFWLIGLDVGRASLLLFLPWIQTTIQLYILIFVLNALSAGFTPVFQALIPDVFEDEDTYTRALSYSRLAYELERILSPSFAALALLLMSYHVLFVLNAVSFVASAVLLSLTLFPEAKPSQRTQGLLYNITFGIKAYMSTPRLRGLLALQLSVAATGSMIIINTVGYVQGVLKMSERATMWMMACSGLGAIIAARFLPTLLERGIPERRLMLWSGLGMPLALLPAALHTPHIVTLGCVWFAIGAASSFVLTATGRVITRSCSSSDRNAFFSAHFSLSHAMWLLCYPLAGWLGTRGFLNAAIGLTAVAALGWLIAVWTWPRHDPSVLTHTHSALEHEHMHFHDEHHQHEHEGWEGEEPHSHPHYHQELTHSHPFVIDEHHPIWPG